MKVSAWVEQSMEVDVSLDDIFAELAAQRPPQDLPALVQALNIGVGLVKRAPDSMIALLNADQKRLIHDALVTQATRYAPREGVACTSAAASVTAG